MRIKKYFSFLIVLTIAAGLGAAVPAFAKMGIGGIMSQWHQRPIVFGTVSAMSGNTITVTDTSKNTSYTVDATNATVTKNGATSSITNIVVGDTVMVQGTLNGTTVTAKSIRDGVPSNMMVRKPGIVGAVSVINGSTIMVLGNARRMQGNATTYTVDASSASVVKNGQASSVPDIAVGDMVMVQGTVSGTNIKAIAIKDGIGMDEHFLNPVIQGNGQPIVAGKITAINGNTLIITNGSNIAYTIDVTNAKIAKGNTTESLSNLSVGDTVIVQGTVNGNSITASSIIAHSGNENPPAKGLQNHRSDFMGGMINFFKHLFGF